MGSQRTSVRPSGPIARLEITIGREIKRNGRKERREEGKREEDSDYDEMAYLNPEHVRRHTGAQLLPPSDPNNQGGDSEEGSSLQVCGFSC